MCRKLAEYDYNQMFADDRDAVQHRRSRRGSVEPQVGGSWMRGAVISLYPRCQ